MRYRTAAAVGAVLVFLGAGCRSDDDDRGLAGYVVAPEEWCGGATSFQPGDRVTVRDGDGQVLGRDGLGPTTRRPNPDPDIGTTCAWPFVIDDLATAPRYAISVTGAPGAVFGFTADQLESRNGAIDLVFEESLITHRLEPTDEIEDPSESGASGA